MCGPPRIAPQIDIASTLGAACPGELCLSGCMLKNTWGPRGADRKHPICPPQADKEIGPSQSAQSQVSSRPFCAVVRLDCDWEAAEAGPFQYHGHPYVRSRISDLPFRESGYRAAGDHRASDDGRHWSRASLTGIGHDASHLLGLLCMHLGLLSPRPIAAISSSSGLHALVQSSLDEELSNIHPTQRRPWH